MELIYSQYFISQIQQDRLRNYLLLFKSTFPNYKRDLHYLEWLYFQNPRGQVLGFDAIFEDRVVAHYACIPIKIFGFEGFHLLSLNTATAVEHQGKGLFTKLAELTFAKAIDFGFEGVVGVANKNSVQGFLTKLGFKELGQLNLRFGKISRARNMTREFESKEIIWLKNQPGRKSFFRRLESGDFIHSVWFPFFPFKLRTVCFTDQSSKQKVNARYGLTVDWSLTTERSLNLPASLKPSPLHLIYKSFNGKLVSPIHSWSYLDFDMI